MLHAVNQANKETKLVPLRLHENLSDMGVGLITYSVGNASPIDHLIFYLHQQQNQGIDKVIMGLCFDDFERGKA